MRFNDQATKVKVQGSLKDHWYTPEHVLGIVRECLETIVLDPCTSPENPAQATRFFTEAEDGLSRPWEDGFFCNPPFSTKAHWIQKAMNEHKEGFLLVPSACLHNKSTRRMFIWASSIAMLGRVKFVPSPELIAAREAEGLPPASTPQDDMILVSIYPQSRNLFPLVCEDLGYTVFQPVDL